MFEIHGHKTLLHCHLEKTSCTCLQTWPVSTARSDSLAVTGKRNQLFFSIYQQYFLFSIFKKNSIRWSKLCITIKFEQCVSMSVKKYM